MVVEAYIGPYLSRLRVNAWNIDSRNKLEGRGIVGVIGATVDLNAVDTVLMDTLCSLD